MALAPLERPNISSKISALVTLGSWAILRRRVPTNQKVIQDLDNGEVGKGLLEQHSSDGRLEREGRRLYDAYGRTRTLQGWQNCPRL